MLKVKLGYEANIFKSFKFRKAMKQIFLNIDKTVEIFLQNK